MGIIIDGQEEVIGMLKNSKDGLTLEEMQVHEKFQPIIFNKNGIVMKVSDPPLLAVLQKLTANGTVIEKHDKYYLNQNWR